MHSLKWIAVLFTFATMLCVLPSAQADTIYGGQTFSVSGTAGGQPVNAQAVVSGSGNLLTITVTNLQSDPTSSVQAISGINFTITGATPPGSQNLVGSTGDLITINDTTGAYVDNGVVGSSSTLGLTHWSLDSVGSVTTLTGGQPNELIIGNPNGSNLYASANNGVDNFNPYVKYTATFTIQVNSLNSNAYISSLSFDFGTAPETTIASPVPPSLVMLGTMLVPGLAFWYRRRNSRVTA